MMRPDKLRPIGKTSVRVTQLGFGGAALGNVFDVVGEQDALETIHAAYEGGVRYFDTAPLYGYGMSERRIGRGLARFNRDSFVLSSKVGYSLVGSAPEEIQSRRSGNPMDVRQVFDFSRDAILRSIDESLMRLGTDRIEIVLIHDPDESLSARPGRDPYEKSHFAEVMEQAYPALDELRSQGAIKALGLGMNQWQMLSDFAQAGDFDCFLLAGRYTLLQQDSLPKLLPLCEEKNISIIIGAPFHSGILATGATPNASFNYAPATPEILARTRQIQAVCARHKVALPAAALQFPFGHPSVVSVIPSASSVAEVSANISFFTQTIPADFWAELKSLSLIDSAAPLPLDDEQKL